MLLAGTSVWSSALSIGERAVTRVFGGASAPAFGLGGTPPVVPTVTATKTAQMLFDPDANDKADPGDTIRYTVSVAASGADATGVHFADTPDANTTLLGSVVISPLAINESYNAVGNMTLT